MLELAVQRGDRGGISTRSVYRDDRHWFVCRSCNVAHRQHVDSPEHVRQLADDFREKHPVHRGCYVVVWNPANVEAMARRTERRRGHLQLAKKYAHNSDVKAAFQSEQTVDLTSFNSLASSATAGWSSHYVDNSSNLYLDLLAYLKIAAVNTAPGSNKAFYVYGATASNTTDLPTSGASSGNTVANSSTTSAALTFPSIATPLPSVFGGPIKVIPYPVQNVANSTGLFSSAVVCGQIAQYFWWPLLNYSGMTIAASGNVFKFRGTYLTVI